MSMSYYGHKPPRKPPEPEPEPEPQPEPEPEPEELEIEHIRYELFRMRIPGAGSRQGYFIVLDFDAASELYRKLGEALEKACQ